MNFFRFLKSKSFLVQIAIAVAGIFLLVFVLKWWLTTLKELNLDFIVIDSASYNPNYPKKSVIDQTPKFGDFVKEKRKIYLTLNPTKYRDVSIPDMNGLSKRQAITQLESIGFKIGDISYIPDVGKNVVRGLKFNGKKIKSGAKLSKNATIDLILGDGKL